MALLGSERGKLVAAVGRSGLAKGIKARSIIKAAAGALGGGGKPDLAQGGGPNVERLDEALAAGREAIRAEGAFYIRVFNILTGLASEISQGRVQWSLNADHGTVIEQVDPKSFQ